MPELPRRGPSTGPDIRVRRRQPDVTPIARGIQSVAEAGAQMGATFRDLGDRLQRMENEKRVNKANDIYNNAYREATTAFIDEINNDGRINMDPENPDENPLQRFGRITQDILNQRLEGVDDSVANLVRTRFSQRQNYWDERLAVKQTKDIRKNAMSNLEQASDNYAASVFADPGSLENVLDAVDTDIAAAGLRGEDAQNKRIEMRDRLAKESLLGIAQTQPKTAEKLLESGAYDNLFKDPDSKRELQRRIKTQVGLLKGKRDEAIEQAREKWRNDALDKMSRGELREAQIRTSPLEAKEKSQWIGKLKTQAKDFNAFLNSDDIIKADVTERVYTEPDTITEDEIFDLMGKGLSTPDATSLGNKLREIKGKKGDPLKNSEISQALKQLELMRQGGFFDPDAKKGKLTVENNIEAGRQKVALEQWARENPDKSPLDYIDTLSKTKGGGMLDWISSFFTTSDLSVSEGLLPVTQLSEEAIEKLTPAELRGQLEAETEQGRRARESVEQLRATSSKAMQMLRQAGLPVTRANVEEVTRRLLREEQRGQR